jgi:acetylornithine deacetylase
MVANATALLSIRVAADLDETIALVKSVVGNHEGVKLTIEVSLPPVPLDSDVGGFQTIVVSYFTVHPPYMFANVQDVPHLRGDFKRYLYGPGRYYALERSNFAHASYSITSAHGPNEHVAKADLLEAVEGYKKLILHALG